MCENKFSHWINWQERLLLQGLNSPGVYICAITTDDIANQQFSWLQEITYIGMTNAKLGLRGRLKQFDNTIRGKSGHGGADRFRFKYPDYAPLLENLYVSVAPFSCNVLRESPEDLRVMGAVAKFEYDCFAAYKEIYECLPEFNNKKLSPKYSLTIGRANS